MKSPAFQFYPKDFLTDPLVVVMTNEARGAYMTLLCYCWLSECRLPADQEFLAGLVGLAPKDFSRVWKTVGRCFTKTKAKTPTLTHPRLERERKKQQTVSKVRSVQGKRGNKKRWSGSGLDRKREGLGIANDRSSSSSSTPVLEEKKINKRKEDRFHESAQRVLEHWNTVTDKLPLATLRSGPSKIRQNALKLISVRLGEGYTEEALAHHIDVLASKARAHRYLARPDVDCPPEPNSRFWCPNLTWGPLEVFSPIRLERYFVKWADEDPLTDDEIRAEKDFRKYGLVEGECG